MARSSAPSSTAATIARRARAVRGFATARRAPRQSRAWSRHDLAFAISALAVLALGIGGAAAVSFAAYPKVHIAIGALTGVVCVALIVAAVLPFCDRRGIEP